VPLVLLATFNLCPDGEPGGDLLVAALAERGIESRWVCWDDPGIDWPAADLVAVRATWDYQRRHAEFVDWAHAVERSTPFLNGADVFAWNADKAYLLELAERVPVVPTALVDDRTLVPGLRAAVERHGPVVIKPRTGASGVGVVVLESVEDPRLQGLTRGPWVVQPLVESVRTRGETSVYVLDGRAVAQLHKQPGGAEIRVHELYGGETRAVDLDEASAAVALAAMEGAATVLGSSLDYGRVDLVEHDGRLVVGEVELIEPGLYLDVLPGLAEPFADLVAARLPGT
jgi:glutathione synthase/RimK-type ligase-like ATP-grasp enzyme